MGVSAPGFQTLISKISGPTDVSPQSQQAPSKSQLTGRTRHLFLVCEMSSSLQHVSTAAALSLLASLSAAATGFDGQAIGLQYQTPTLGTPFGTTEYATVNGNVEFPLAFTGLLSVDLSATQITITALGDIPFPNNTFEGFRFFDADNTAPSLVGVTLNGGSSVSPVLTFDANNIYVNLAGIIMLSANQNFGGQPDQVVIDLDFGSVPEPSTAVAGVFLAGAVASVWLRRRSVN